MSFFFLLCVSKVNIDPIDLPLLQETKAKTNICQVVIMEKVTFVAFHLKNELF